MRAFYRGLGASVAGIAPYMAIELSTFDLLAGSGAGSGGGSSRGENEGVHLTRTDTAALSALVRQVRRLNTQESFAGRESATTDELDRFTAVELRRAIINDSGGNGGRGGGGRGGGENEEGLLDFESFRRFFQSTGGMINLNRDASRG